MGAHFRVEIKENRVVKAPTALFLEAWDLREWVEVVNSLSDIQGIQPIHLENGQVIQPPAPGCELATMGMAVSEEPVRTQIDRICTELRSRGYDLDNIHPGNVFFDSGTGEITIVDLGELKVIANEAPHHH